MEIVRGIAAAPGLGIAKAFVLKFQRAAVPCYLIDSHLIGTELERFSIAKEKVRTDLLLLKKQKSKLQHYTFIDAHLLMLEDPMLNDEVERRIQNSYRNTEYVLYEVVGELLEMLGDSPHQQFQERSIDISDVANRLLDHLTNSSRFSLANLSEKSIVVAHDLYPTETLDMNRQYVLGLITDLGGTTSHTSILARAFNIPAVVGVTSNLSQTLKSGTMLVVDGSNGTIYIDPDEETLTKFRQKQAQRSVYWNRLLSLNLLPAVTEDGKSVTLKANIELPEEVELASENEADGIGLFRSEFLFLSGYSPSEEEQYKIYSQVLEKMDGQEVTIRSLDLGGDKISSSNFIQERNPLLGCRAIRFCISRPEMFRSHLRAMLRSSVHGKMRLMLPMISGHRELIEVKKFFEKVKEELRSSGIPFDEQVPLGVMIEVPSAAMASDLLAKEVDFFSIGTNDLIQYSIAIDRNNSQVAYLHDPFHVGIVRLIKTTIDNAHRAGIPVAMCGEMASDSRATPLLIGLGLDELSMSPIHIPEIKQIIRNISFIAAEEFASQVLEVTNFAEMERLLQDWNSRQPYDDLSLNK